MDSITTNEFCFKGSLMQIKKLWITDRLSVKKKLESFAFAKVSSFNELRVLALFEVNDLPKICLFINNEIAQFIIHRFIFPNFHILSTSTALNFRTTIFIGRFFCTVKKVWRYPTSLIS